MHLIERRGPFSAAVMDALRQPASAPADESLRAAASTAVAAAVDVIADDDLQLGLHLLYELHFGGLEGVDDAHEWSPPLLAARAVVERAFEAALRRRFPAPAAAVAEASGGPAEVARVLFDLAGRPGPPGGSISGHVARHATGQQVAEMLVMRSPYQLKEADPQTCAVPRLRGRAKAALVEIQFDEYGGGRVERMHARLFARCMRALGLDDTPYAYLDHVPARWLAASNAVSMFGLHRRLRAALCGHLAMTEMTSSLPSKRWVAGLERLGLGPDATEFFDEHVEADAVHEQIAAHDLCGSLVADDPALLDDVLFGACACAGLEAEAGDAVLAAWRSGRSALRRPLPSLAGPFDVPAADDAHAGQLATKG